LNQSALLSAWTLVCTSRALSSTESGVPQDYILFAANQLKTRAVFKDNTGKKKYTEGMVFPTLAFPSDHGILGATLEPQTSAKTEL
jgi:hypothetical protein